MDKQYDIKEVRERFNRYNRLEKLIQEKGRQLAVQRDRLSDLYRQLEKENRDVEELERASFSSLLARITGQMEQKMEKEVQEARIVELRFNDAKRVEKELLEELTKLKDEQYRLRNVKEEYKIALSMKRDQLSPSQLEEMDRLQDELHDCQSTIKESKEALTAGEEAKELVERAQRSLSSAQNWGIVDMIGALDFIADMAKYQKINEAKQLMNELQMALRRFKTELVDVNFDARFVVNISSFDTMMDFFFDNMFFDFMVQSKINDAKRQMDGIYDQINNIMAELESINDRNTNKISELKEKIRQFIEEA
ncbi:MAG: hypothetical protein ACLRVU_10565 [Beduini sp.]|uniref:hypothetical protein n=1 Tax=Beduini sp. TaxID=1922300 RepID=UPI00399FE924